MGVNALGRRAAQRFVIIVGAPGHRSPPVDRLLPDSGVESVTVYDNFSSGRRWHLAAHEGNPQLTIVEADVKDLDTLTAAMRGNDTVIHLASNPDIARAATEPSVDFDEGTLLTHHVVGDA